MEALTANLFLALQQRINTITVNSKPLFPTIDQDFGQLEDEQPAVSWPCILIDIKEFEWQPIGNNCQIGVGHIRLRVAFTPYSGTNVRTPPKFKEKALSYYDMEERLHKAMQGWSPSDQALVLQAGESQPEGWSDIFGSLDRVSAVTNSMRTDYRIRDLVYSIGADDYGTKNVITKIPATPVITTDIVAEL